MQTQNRILKAATSGTELAAFVWRTLKWLFMGLFVVPASTFALVAVLGAGFNFNHIAGWIIQPQQYVVEGDHVAAVEPYCADGQQRLSTEQSKQPPVACMRIATKVVSLADAQQDMGNALRFMYLFSAFCTLFVTALLGLMRKGSGEEMMVANATTRSSSIEI